MITSENELLLALPLIIGQPRNLIIVSEVLQRQLPLELIVYIYICVCVCVCVCVNKRILHEYGIHVLN